MQLLFHGRHHHHDHHHHGKKAHHKGKKTYKLMKKIAKLEKIMSKNSIGSRKASSSDSGSPSDSDSSARSHSRYFHKRMSRCQRRQHHHHHQHGKCFGSHGRSSSSSSSSSGSSSTSNGGSRSPSPHHHRRGPHHGPHHPHHGGPRHHLTRSKSFSGRPSRSPPPCLRGRPHWRHQCHHPSGGRQDGVRGCRYTVIDPFRAEPQEKSAEEEAGREPVLVDLSCAEAEADDQVQEAEPAEAVESSTPEGPELDVLLAENWARIVREGLPDGAREVLLEKYPVSRNCLALRAPKTNAEILYTATEAAVKRDKIQMYEQSEIATGLTALGHAITDLNNKSELKKDKEVADILETLNEAAVILADVQYNMTKTRQAFILPELAKRVRPVAETCDEPDEFLFGNNFAERVKDIKGFRMHKNKAWKRQNAVEQCEKEGKRKHADQDCEKRKIKRLESLGPFKRGYAGCHHGKKH